MELKQTKQRDAIISVLDSVSVPVSAEYIYNEIKSSFPSVAVSTVYRNLEKFLSAGLIKKEVSDDGIMRFSSARQHGHFIICTFCGIKYPLPHCPISDVEDRLSRETGFLISGHNITIYGKCPKCQKSNNA